jgi:serine/threonine protein kinase
MPQFADFEQASAWLRRHDQVRAVDLLLPDLMGIPRGKRVTAKELEGVHRNGLLLPASMFALDVLGGLEKARETFQNATPCSEPEGVPHLQRGTTLRQLIERTHTLAERSALLPLFAEACRIVAAVHARGTVHRNLQPNTILIAHSPSVAVVDWSAGRVRGKQDPIGDALAQAVKRLRDDQAPDDALAIVLDPAYLAPELALGHIEDIDARSDVYALGAILYGLTLFQSEKSKQALAQQ